MHSRLLLDLNRSVDSKNLWSYSSNSRGPEAESPFGVLCPLSGACQSRLGSIQFVVKLVSLRFIRLLPVLNGKTRSTDVGLLFHHASEKERLLAESLRFYLCRELPDWKIHFNLPYRGFTDCFLNDLSQQYQANLDVVGLFLEFNQSRIGTLSERRKLSEKMKRAILLASGVN